MEESRENARIALDDVYATLRMEILTLQINPGEMVSENMLAVRFGISRTPVRSIIMRLAQDGLIVQQGRKGNHVSLIDLDMAEQIIFMRIQLETAAMKKLILHPAPGLLSALEKNLEQQSRVKDTDHPVENFYRVDSDFHGLCMEAAGRLKIWNMIQNMDVHYCRYRRLDYTVFQDDHVFENLYENHQRLYEILRSRDCDSVEREVTKHLYSGMIRIGRDICHDYSDYFATDVRSLDNILKDIRARLDEIGDGNVS